jgi:hypothetical protein
MINKGEDQISKRLRKIRRKERWNRGRRGLSPHFLEILLKENQLPRGPT